jgi:crotonobetainyl-CoA:carnitine CoA-transferase CaiB-like acyl-CoA transferase
MPTLLLDRDAVRVLLYMPIRCKDGWVHLACVEEHQFDSLVEV